MAHRVLEGCWYVSRKKWLSNRGHRRIMRLASLTEPWPDQVERYICYRVCHATCERRAVWQRMRRLHLSQIRRGR